MSLANKILVSVFIFLVAITLVEVSYLWFFNSKKLQLTKLETIPSVSNGPQNITKEAKNPSLSKEDLKTVLNPQYQKFLPLSYDENKDRFYINIPGKSYVDLRKRMAIDYATWITLATYSKDLIDSYILIQRLKGKVTELKLNKTSAGYKNLSFKLQGEEGSHIGHHYGENKLKTMKFIKVIDGKEIPMELDELKENDKITIEDKLNLTKYPRDTNLMTEQTVLTKY